MAMALLFACQKTETPEEEEKTEEQEEVVVDNYEATITLSNTTVNIGPEEGDSDVLIFSCDHQWTLDIPEEAQTWLSADKMSGKPPDR